MQATSTIIGKGGGSFAFISLLALAGCSQAGGDKAADAAAAANLTAVLDPAVGTGPWFICDALNAPTVIVASRPSPAGEVTVATRDKDGVKPASVTRYMLGAPKPETGSVVRTLSRDGAEIGHVRTLDASALPDPAAVTAPPVSEVKIDDVALSCRWLARTRLMGVTGKRTVVVNDETDGPVYRTFEFADSATAKPANPDTAQRSTTPSLEVRKGVPFGDDWGFSVGEIAYSVGDGGVTILQSRRVISGEPFIAAKSTRAPAGG